MAAGPAGSRAVSIAVGDYPLTRGFRTAPAQGGQGADYRFETVGIGGSAIADMVRRQVFDACEMPIVTFLQAFAQGLPLALLPVALVTRLQHGTLLHDASRGELCPSDLAGRRVGVRSWTRTTGVWMRGILAHEYGVDPGRVDWVTFEASHLAPVADPSRRAGPGKTALGMLFEGELDAVIGETSDDPRLRPVVAEPDAAARAWCAAKGFMPVNHMLVLREALVEERPDAAAAIWSVARRGQPAPDGKGPDTNPMGVEANRKALETIIAFSAEQGIVPPGIGVDDLFAEAVRRIAAE